MSLAEARAYLRAMPFLPVTPAFFAALHEAVVEELVFDAAASRLQLTLRLVSFTNDRFVHRREQVVLSGLRHGANLERCTDASTPHCAKAAEPNSGTDWTTSVCCRQKH
jgi:hypothetical protein